MWLVILLILCVAFIVLSTARLKMHPFLSLLIAAFTFGVLCRRMSLAEVVESVNTGFGSTIGYIGIVILAGSVIGTFLEKSGGAMRLAEGMLRLVGRRNVPLALGLTGYVVSIPVFCDSGFVILAPLAKALCRRAKIPIAAGAIALSLGLYATHTMVPPTPGPIAAACLLEADLGLVILWGSVVSLIALCSGWLFAVRFAGRAPTDGHVEPEQSKIPEVPADAPSTLRSIAPILLPIVLIVLKSVADYPSRPLGQGSPAVLVSFVGQPVVALLLGVLIALLLPKRLDRKMLSADGWVGQAVTSAAKIIIITGCGGAFARVLQNAGIGDVLAEHIGSPTSLTILMPFIIAAAFKTAQGSSTVAIITTAGITAGLLEPLGLAGPTARALVVVAIGAGSMVVCHANDSYFWVVTGMSGLSVKQGYRFQTLGTLVQGSVAVAALWIISLLVL